MTGPVMTVADLTLRHVGQSIRVNTRHGALEGVLVGITHEAETFPTQMRGGSSEHMVGRVESSLVFAGFGEVMVRAGDTVSVVKP